MNQFMTCTVTKLQTQISLSLSDSSEFVTLIDRIMLHEGCYQKSSEEFIKRILSIMLQRYVMRHIHILSRIDIKTFRRQDYSINEFKFKEKWVM